MAAPGAVAGARYPHPEPPSRRVLRAGAGAAYRRVLRPALWRLDAEDAHHGTVRAAELTGAFAVTRALSTLAGAALGPGRQSDPVQLFGVRFGHRVGLAAGMDKDGRALPAWAALGLGHVELGTVTARPQPGNPRPRLHRLPASGAVVNAMGFNNLGVHALAARLHQARQAGLVRVPVGVSIGKNKDTPVAEATGDYLESVAALCGLADYLAVNVSSPNTPGLRSLQDAGPLRELLDAVVAAADVPVLVKLSPDLGPGALEQAVEVAVGAGVRGVIATNTTLSRDGLTPVDRARLGTRAGGVSGAPLTTRSREVVRSVRALTDLPVIGVGGVMTGADAAALREAGADLVQLWTGLVYAGPTLVGDAARAISAGSARR
jgi:dihydroorotate dehydrogenase